MFLDLQGDIYNQLIKYMKIAERHVKSNQGIDKKKYVLRKLKENIGNDVFERYEPFIDISIDFIIYIYIFIFYFLYANIRRYSLTLFVLSLLQIILSKNKNNNLSIEYNEGFGYRK